METLNIRIGGRTYPLSLQPEEVAAVRQAAEDVEAQLATLKSQYAISDRIDLMAMTALQIAVQARQGSPGTPTTAERTEPEAPWPSERIDDLLHQLQDVLQR